MASVPKMAAANQNAAPTPCPFTGETVFMKHTAIGWVIVGKHYVMGPYPSKVALMKTFANRIGEEKPPLLGPSRVLPWSGEPVEYVKVGDVHECIVMGPKFLMGTFKFLKDAQVAFSTRGGIEPKFKDPVIQVREVLPEEGDDAEEGTTTMFPDRKHYDPSIIPIVKMPQNE